MGQKYANKSCIKADSSALRMPLGVTLNSDPELGDPALNTLSGAIPSESLQ